MSQDREQARKPYEGHLVLAVAARPLRKDRIRSEPIETLRCKGAASAGFVARRVKSIAATSTREEAGAGAYGQGFGGWTLEGRSPREHPADVGPNKAGFARDFREGQNLEAAACRAGPVLRHPGTTAGETAGRCIDVGNGTVPRGRGKLRRAESHERRRYETGPAGNRRE